MRGFSSSFNLRSSSQQEKDDKYDEEDLDWARSWISEANVNKKIAKLPPSIGVITFSRSSGPGGQNVNKVNSKATLRVPLDKLGLHIPRVFFEALKSKGSKYLTDGGDMVISSDSCRSQLTNTKDCWAKLYQAVINSVRIPGKTSQGQRKRVKRLMQISDAKTRDLKSKLSKRKADRRGGPVGEW
ncbi:uncharacterized protein DFL_006289 [Arthrobotrys flagrans]|uniref:Prokaryotic-type class I peptide chain release factors domain-containing protein n=1 Tax=Arthrobotrys flagrans TaxID=97331 RepID=A0A437A0P9_ARTFL|nr:hypothetical protein DFL_006289 [Arthrobotrys flagrans]